MPNLEQVLTICRPHSLLFLLYMLLLIATCVRFSKYVCKLKIKLMCKGDKFILTNAL